MAKNLRFEYRLSGESGLWPSASHTVKTCVGHGLEEYDQRPRCRCPDRHCQRRGMSNEQRNFLALPYAELEELNLKAKEQRKTRVPADKIREERLKYLTDEKCIKAVTVMFSDLEGRLHMLDYDKKFLLKSWDNLTFDGSSIRGFTAQKESDLRLGVDWSAFYWGPADVFGEGKVMVFGEVQEKDGSPYIGDMREIG